MSELAGDITRRPPTMTSYYNFSSTQGGNAENQDMSALSSRKISISDHHRRRKASGAPVHSHSQGSVGSNGSRGSGGSGGDGTSRRSSSSRIGRRDGPMTAHLSPLQACPAPRPPCRPSPPACASVEGGYDCHAASYGNYDAPYRGTSPDHGCYAAESYIGGYASKARADLSPTRRYSNPAIDLEGGRSYLPDPYDDRRRSRSRSRPRRPPSSSRRSDPALRLSQASTVPTAHRRTSSHQDVFQLQDLGSWEEEAAYSYGQCSLDSDPRGRFPGSYCGGGATVATASTSNTSFSGSTLSDHEERLRQGIVDVSSVIATYVAGFLSFVVGIFLTLVSPFVKVIKLIVGDVRGLLGDAAFLQEVGSLWRMYRELRRRGRRSDGERGDCGYGHRNGNNCYDDDSTNEGNGTVYTDGSSQFVGGWRPSVDDGAVGSRDGSSWAASSSRRSDLSSRGRGGASEASRSYSSLPLVREERRPRDRGGAPRHAPPSHRRTEASSSRHPDDRMYQDHPRGGDPRGYYTNHNYPSSPQIPRHHAMPPPPIPSSPYEQSYPSRTTIRQTNSPKKRLPHGGALPPPPRSRSCVV